MMDDPRYATAAHECGHLLAAWERNIVVRRVVVASDGSGYCEPLVSLDRYPADDVRFFCFAGSAAAAQLAGVHEPPSLGDFATIGEAGHGFMSTAERRAMESRADTWAWRSAGVLRFLTIRLLATGRFHAQLGRNDFARLVREAGVLKEFRHLYPQTPPMKPSITAKRPKPTVPAGRGAPGLGGLPADAKWNESAGCWTVERPLRSSTLDLRI